MRASIALKFLERSGVQRTILIDTGPDFRTQALRFGITAVDAVLYTHGHADHVLGFDDLRPLTFGKPAHTPLYADDPTAKIIERIFDYTFRTVDRYPTSARVDLHRLSTEPGTTLSLFGACFERIPVIHGRNTIAGYRFGSAAYLTDMSDIPEASFDRLRNLDIVVLDALRREPHPSHSHLNKSIAFAARIGAKQTYFTHISHDLDHGPTTENLPPNIHLAYDGLCLPFNIAEPMSDVSKASNTINVGNDPNVGDKSNEPTTITGESNAIPLNSRGMTVFRSLAEIPANFGPSIVTIGNFDGVHCGHQTVIREVVARSRQRNTKAVLVTLDPHPAKILRPDKAPKLITPLPILRAAALGDGDIEAQVLNSGEACAADQSRVPHLREAKVGDAAAKSAPANEPLKLELLAATGLDAALLLPFTEAFSRTSPRTFCEVILRDALRALEVHEGENFRFGYAAEADMHSLESLGIDCGFTAHTFAPFERGRAAVSSSRIRTVIAEGDMSAARHMLGRPFSVDSTPARGRGYGTQHAVPTINLAPYAELLPANGVYITQLRIRKEGTGQTTTSSQNEGVETTTSDHGGKAIASKNGNAENYITFEGVTNIGNRPTFGADSFAVETYCFDFHPIELSESTPLRLTFLKRLREEKKWPTPDALKQQITQDVALAERYFHLRRLLTKVS